MNNRENTSKDMIEYNQNYFDNINKLIKNKDLKYHITTYGCQMNVHDSEKLAGMLAAIGYTQAPTQEDADLILFNTCCVRENAEQRVYGNVGSLYARKQENPDLIIGVCGCMMQQEDVASYIAHKFPFVDLIFGTHNLHHFPKLLLEAIGSKETTMEILYEKGQIVEDVPIKRNPGVSAWTTIMYGCNNFCSYCIVPYVRGRERSREPHDILDEITSLSQSGYKEVTLLGQNVNSYGTGNMDSCSFSNLLRDINQIRGIERIRFMTSHPKDLSDDLIKAMGESDKVCEHIHLPIQSGSNKILKAMNRKYNRDAYLELVRKLREQIPGIAITTDIIVGFPGETDEDFSQTLDIVERVGFDSAYTFIYSPRKGTPASKLTQQIDKDIVKKRLHTLMDYQNKVSKEINDKYLGKTLGVLAEGTSKNNKDIYSGRSRTNKLVHFSAPFDVTGKIVKVKISDSKTWTLQGTMI